MSRRVRGTHHVGFTVASLERSLAFWGLLGYTERQRFRFGSEDDQEGTGVAGADYELVLCSRGDTSPLVELIQYRGAEETPAPANHQVGAAHLALEVDDVEGIYRELSAAGVEFLSPPHRQEDSGVIWVYAKDPDGITVELLEPIGART